MPLPSVQEEKPGSAPVRDPLAEGVIDALGGYRIVAAQAGIGRERVNNWLRRGLSRDAYPILLRLASRVGRLRTVVKIIVEHEASDSRQEAA